MPVLTEADGAESDLVSQSALFSLTSVSLSLQQPLLSSSWWGRGREGGLRVKPWTKVHGGGERLALGTHRFRNLEGNQLEGPIPPELGNIISLERLDLSFNKLTGQIPEKFIGMGELQYLDVSYNNFMGNPPAQCQQANVNMVSSFYLQVAHSSLFINCGGKNLEVDGNIYADDSFEIGTSTFVLSDDRKWAYNSTGDFVGNENADYIARNTSKLTLPHPELYTEAHLLPLSLKYYGLCMENGEYSVKLHFAEIVFTEDHTCSSNGKRVFDVLI
ncbi:hypothetical protein ABZP36_013600 [Zizania latifolia]